MSKIEKKLLERRKHIRLPAEIPFCYAAAECNAIEKGTTKNISAEGIGFETGNKGLKEDDILELNLRIPASPNPVHARGRVVWKKKTETDDAAPFDVGVEFVSIEEDNKNTFLKFLCDMIYNLRQEGTHEKKG